MKSPLMPGEWAHTGAPQTTRTLRALLTQRKAEGRHIDLSDAIRWVVPLCVEVADLHRQGYGVHLHPSNLILRDGALKLSSELAATPPDSPADIACMPREHRAEQLGDSHASVFSTGAILYEMVTGESVGPKMQRPGKLVQGIPHSFEVLLGNALISDPSHRPGDLNALAQAIYHILPPAATPPPPAADEQRVSMLAVDVDVSLSMLPPDELMAAPGSIPKAPRTANIAVPAGVGYNVGVVDARQPGDAATAALAERKAHLEADNSPRYVVVKNGMDHGPFSGLELAQQLRQHTFDPQDEVLDQKTGQQRPIVECPQFSSFAEHAQRHRELQHEKAAVERGVAQESRSTRGKVLLGLLFVGVLLAGAATWFTTQVGTRSDEVAVHTEDVSQIEAEGAVKKKHQGGKAGKGGKRRRVVGSQGGIPILGGGMSCEAARAAYVEEISMQGGKADITRGQYANIMNSGNYFSHCGVPGNVGVKICVAVQAGRAVGVTVRTSPRHGSRRCIDSAVRRLKFPSHPKLDVVRVNFAAQ